MSAQVLLRKLLEMAGGPAETGYVLALDGEGLEDVADRFETGHGTYDVYRPGTELGLRRLIGRAAGAPFVALLKEELARRLPPDLVRRARNARVVSLELTDVLSLHLGVPVVGTEDPELVRLANERLEDIRREMSHRTLPTVIDRKLLDELLLDVCIGKRVRTASAGQLLAEWLHAPPDWSNALRELVCRSLPVLHAIDGQVLAWALRDRPRMSAVIVHGALLDLDPDPAPPVWGPLYKAEEDACIGLTREVFRGVVVRMARQALDALGDAGAVLLTEAESLGRKVLSAQALAQSTVLPLGLENRFASIATRAAKGEAVPGTEIDWLRNHRAAQLKKAEISVLEDMARLSRYLAEPEPAAGAGVVEQVRRYQTCGAFADLAAARLARSLGATGDFHREAEQVLGAYRTRRDRDNLAFATGVAAGYVKALHGEDVVPLHRLFSKVALREEGEARRKGNEGGLFLLVMDGCSYPVFLELVQELSQSAGFPVGLRLAEDGSAQGLPGLAPLPTITSHARSAIFLGEIPKDPWIPEAVWRDGPEAATDSARFKQNATLKDRSRQLFLKGDLADGGAELREALRGGRDVVAAVFNAVDDQIGSTNTGARIHLRAEAIAGFLPSLKAALEAGRKVLFVADHGHTPFWGRDLRAGAGQSARFLELQGEAKAPEGFMEVNLDGLGGTPGRKAFAWRMGAYLGTPQVGFHGGCSLEEMVVPLAWLTLRGVPADEPSWWYGRAQAPVVVETRPAPLPVPAREAKPVRAQQDLFDPKRNLEAVATRIGRLNLPEPAVAELEIVEQAALVVLAENGVAKARDLAAKIGKPPGRMSGFMTKLNRKLHQAGVECLRTELLPNGESQYHYVPQPGGEEP